MKLCSQWKKAVEYVYFSVILTSCTSASMLPTSGSASHLQRMPVSNQRSVSVPNFNLSDDEALEIGRRIWKNECRGTVEGLTSWNKNEEFPSLGIAHCIWFPAGYTGAFGESFPRLVDFLLTNGGATYIPEWLKERWEAGERTCPWTGRDDFLRAKDTPAMRELRVMLASTVSLQARFIANRMEVSLLPILAVTASADTARIKAQFYRVAAAPYGLYVLTDYINFKGEGIKELERYSKRGWGLRHVLQGMNGTEPGRAALVEFATAAKRCLSERVKFAPPERNEVEWLQGWIRRVDDYTSSE
jgi:hypothetical protein